MASALSVDLRARVVAAVEEGASRRIEAHGAQRALMDRYGSRSGGSAA